MNDFEKPQLGKTKKIHLSEPEGRKGALDSNEIKVKVKDVLKRVVDTLPPEFSQQDFIDEFNDNVEGLDLKQKHPLGTKTIMRLVKAGFLDVVKNGDAEIYQVNDLGHRTLEDDSLEDEEELN